ncbi:hypothetical protein KR222_009507, partial [Zaprionus bogoriensis]
SFAMCRTHRNWCWKSVQWTLRSTLYASWALGLFSFVYNSKTKKLKRSMWLLVYGILLSSTIVLGMLKTFSGAENPVIAYLYKRNPLVKQLNLVHNYLILLTIFTTYFRSWWLSADLERILNKMLRIYQHFFKAYDFKQCLNFEYFILSKGLIIVLELATVLVIDLIFTHTFSFRMLLNVICMVAIQLGILLLGMHFHIAAIFIYRFVWIINGELLELVYSPNRSSNKVKKLLHLYSQILELNLRLVAAYDYQIILFILCMLTVSILSTHYFIVYISVVTASVSPKIVLGMICFFLVNSMDFWLHISICELSERASRGTSMILKLFNNMPNLDLSMDRSLTDFALFCSHRRLEYKHCDLFHLHNAMGFRMIICCVLHLVYILQYNYMDL